jgi:SNF2 family DNA or RNA helicase
LAELRSTRQLPPLDLLPEFQYEEAKPAPRPRLCIKKGRSSWNREWLQADLSFDYDGVPVAGDDAARHVYQAERKRLIHRDTDAEAAAHAQLRQVGFRARVDYFDRQPRLELTPKHLPKAVRALIDAGWHVEAEGKLYRQAGDFHIEVNSGIDWFELHGSVQFGNQSASLPKLLAALRRGDNLVQLDDGTFGMLPEAWLKKYGLLAGLGKTEDDHLRFARTQVGVLDALLAAQPDAKCDSTFRKARDELRKFAGVAPLDPPAEFVGKLRDYQREGLGWLSFLPRFGFGGCLADDMGLGKTVQVLALLAGRHGAKDRSGPSLVVVPRSLVFNWKQEAARFTPNLRVLDHTGLERLKPGEHFQDYDLILTTYGTLRRDVVEFKDLTFDYCILDESQAIKNASTQSAKAVRLLNARHRLALSGTPVENHLGELWSLFEFLNPGMLGQASVFKLSGAGARKPEPETRDLLARALRPFLLRRTKQQVAKDLPQKTEQTLYCDLEAEQRKQYDELRAYYQQSLLDKVRREGINKAKIQILEALLRLRQAACHPGLIDKRQLESPSAKLDMLLPQLAEVFEEGHKALVFSQFTSLLAIVRKNLDQEKIPYEYLDGKTRDRAARVEHFQGNADCKLFLISLKAGGLGLNLTAAEYVFLLDPWWNPAVEAQAIDRAHRIGQEKPVFAYRLIARDTVEEKVLQLQNTKRALADAIITADNSLIAKLGREDLELLLS